jgi:Na+/H+ antiporter NhaD/arsenite permease-like protein
MSESEVRVKTTALVLFIFMYIIMIAFPKYRTHAALGIGLVYLITGILPVTQLFSIINWNVLMMISGTMVIVDYFIESKMPAFLAGKILDKDVELDD